jgi:hypothetical protein
MILREPPPLLGSCGGLNPFAAGQGSGGCNLRSGSGGEFPARDRDCQ